MKQRSIKRGFTLIEMLLVIALIAILAGIIIIAINPSKQLGDARNAQRRVDVKTILDAIYQYSIDNNALPSGITSSSSEICKTGAASCSVYQVSFNNDLTYNEKYLVAMPIDPIVPTANNGTGYYVYKDSNGRITVSAPRAQDEVISSSVYINATR